MQMVLVRFHPDYRRNYIQSYAQQERGLEGVSSVHDTTDPRRISALNLATPAFLDIPHISPDLIKYTVPTKVSVHDAVDKSWPCWGG